MKKAGSLILIAVFFTISACKKKNNNEGEEQLGQSSPPTISLIGAPSVNSPVGVTYNDLGATATDANGNTIPVTTDASNVNTSLIGSYQVVYTASDSKGNTAQKARAVNVLLTDDTWTGAWNVSHDVKTTLGQNLISNTCNVSLWNGLITLEHDSQSLTGTVNGQNITINPSRVTINFGSGKYDLQGTGSINNSGDEITINYTWVGACGLCGDGAGTAIYTK